MPFYMPHLGVQFACEQDSGVVGFERSQVDSLLEKSGDLAGHTSGASRALSFSLNPIVGRG